MITIIDLFCGCGGFSQGFDNKNIFRLLGIDNWDICLKSHGGEILNFDITLLKRKDLPQEFTKPDIIIGSPPCQTFSTANRHNRNKDDTLIKHFMRIVEELQPRFWIWENVLGSHNSYNGTILDAQNFGVAQRRRRNFVSNFDISNMQEYYQSKKTVKQVLPNIYGSGILDGYNSKVYSLDDVSPTIRRIPLKWYDGRYDKGPFPKKLRFSGFKMLDIQDHLILMGFDKDYIIEGNKTEKMLQIGNCVSPMVAKAISQRILKIW